jgi:hypothetical protein
MVVSILGGPVARGASAPKSTRWNFFANGYVCIQKNQWLIVDVDAQPNCAAARGIPLGVVSGSVPPVVQQGRWRVSRSPLFLSGTLSVDLASVRNTRTTAPRRDRYAESLATVEVASFEQTGATSGTAAARSRNTVFAALPDFASIAPGATVRTGRLATADGHRFGAHIRDASITNEQRTALELKSIELGVPIVVNPAPSRPLGTDCAGPGALGQPDGVGSTTASAMLNDRASRARWLNQVGTSPISRVDEPVGCDESTQVRIVRAAIVGPLVANGQLDQQVDTVVDATLWLLPATR